jgi:hypothetical protein
MYHLLHVVNDIILLSFLYVVILPIYVMLLEYKVCTTLWPLDGLNQMTSDHELDPPIDHYHK